MTTTTMISEDFELITLHKSLNELIENVSCINCCKYYLNPTTATCGHSLCQSCWKGTMRTCPTCRVPIDKKTLRPNAILKSRTEHTKKIAEAYEMYFKIDLNQLTLDSGQVQSVKNWLESSQNNFSAPVINSQQVTQETDKSVHQVTSDVLIHTEHKKVKESKKECVHVNYQQDDWDKIEQMPEVETKTCHGNLTSSVDFESLDIVMDDKENKKNNLRRSSRNKELKSSNPSNEVHNFSLDTVSGKSFNVDLKKQLSKVITKCTKLKRIKKNNKNNKSKLNVSIEMCKKKANNPYNKESSDKSPKLHCNVDYKAPEIVAPNELSTTNNANTNNQAMLLNRISNTNDISNEVQVHESFKQKQRDEVFNKVNFFKRGDLAPKLFDMNNIYVDDNNPANKNTELHTSDTNDIEIQIKIGDTLTNILIKKKANDVQLKVYSDSKVQTSNNFNVENKNNDVNLSIEPPNIQYKKSGNHINLIHVNNNEPADCGTASVQQETASKKNTASADTSTVHLQITESVEKELAGHMENVQFCNEKNKQIFKSGDLLNQCQLQLLPSAQIQEEIELLNDLDIFENESIKEGNAQLLKLSQKSLSEVIGPTANSIAKSRQISNKRNRDIPDKELSNRKKLKMTCENPLKIPENDKKSQNNESYESTEHINYDSVMSQVFANINADMGVLHKSGNNIQQHSQINNTQNSIKKIDHPFRPFIASRDNIDKTDLSRNKCKSQKIREEVYQKCSENVFSLIEKEDANSEIFKITCNKSLERQQFKSTVQGLSPVIRSSNFDTSLKENKEILLSQSDIADFSTPVQDEDVKSVVEETPQKSASFLKNRSNNDIVTGDLTAAHRLISKNKFTSETEKRHTNNVTNQEEDVINVSDSIEQSQNNVTSVELTKQRLTKETPLNMANFSNKITHKSTPVARKSLSFQFKNLENNPEETLSPSSIVVAETTQEKEFMTKAFEQTLNSPAHMEIEMNRAKATRFCIAGSCLTLSEQANLRSLCSQRNWAFVQKYSKDLTHLVVGVDDENKSQRSVKYICALASGKWVISYKWVEKCLLLKDVVDEEPFEVLDFTGEPGPRRSRLAKQKLFQGMTFYCMPPFSILNVETLKDILEESGGRVASDIEGVRVKDAPALLLAEPENTQEDPFIYLAMEFGIVPVNYEWVLNCLGSYTLTSIHELLLCPDSLLPRVTAKWPPELMSHSEE